MSDIKRVVLTTLEPQKVSEKVVKKHCKTVRIRVALPESNEDKCPEYSYKDELAAVKKKLKQNGKETSSAPNGLDPFGEDNDDDVRRIALEMEAKYGTGMSAGTKKKRKGRKDDYADIGAGYDESDSFIDNTDGYDEIIPPNVTTARGGFYINSGALEFKADDDATSEVSSSSSEDESESEEEAENPEKSKRKRALDTTDEEDGNSNHSSQGQAQNQKKQNGDKPNISMQQAIKKKLFSPDKIQIKKRKMAHHKNTVKELLREKRSDPNSGSDTTKDLPKENKKPMKLSSVDDAIDSVIARIEEPPKLPEKSESKPEDHKIEESNNENQLQISNMELDTTATDFPKAELVKLPENLPADILDIIESIKRAARDYKDGGKVKFFSGEVNVMLLNLERKCKVLGRSSRVRVYEHLAPFVRCRKETLIKRAKNLVFEEENKKLKRTIDNLKGHIDQLLPALITNYEKECQRVLQRKFSQEAATNEELKNLKAPRRRFPLHEEMKRMIRDIVNSKKRCLLHEGKPKAALEDSLMDYLKKDILPLWPDGWMSMTVLKKFCTSSALKTPDPKSVAANSSGSTKHSQKLPTSSTIVNYSSGNNLTITPVNLTDKLVQVSANNNTSSSKSDTVIKPHEPTLLQTISKPLQPETATEKIIKPLYKEKSDHAQDSKDNGVIVLSTKTKEDPVIPKDTPHCQIIDLTDTPVKKNSVIEDNPRLLKIPIRESASNQNFEAALKTKFPGLSVTATNALPHNDRDDVQKVMESLRALQKLSSPSKTDAAASNPAVSVIAFNKNYSNSNSGQGSGTSNERTNFSGAIGFQDEFQKQFINSLNHKSASSASSATPAPPSKSSYNRCS